MVKASTKNVQDKRHGLKSYADAVAAMSRQFEEKIRELSTIRRIGDALGHALEIDRVCTLMLHAVMDGLGAEKGVLILFGSRDRVPMVEIVSQDHSLEGEHPFHPTDEMIDWVLRERRPLLIGNLSTESQFMRCPSTLKGSAMTLPLTSRDVDIGVIGLGHSAPDAFRPGQIPAGHVIASQAAIGLDNVRLLHELIRMNENLEEKVLERTQSLQDMNRKLIELQDQLLQAEKMKVIGQFTAGIGHNLRTPLSVILSTADLMRLCGDGDGRILGYVDKITQQSRRMAEIIESLMEKCRKTQNREVERLKINEILTKELSFMEGNLDFKHNVIKECDLAPDLPEIEGFYGDFSQAFINLINNALDAMHGNKTKRLGIRTRHDRNHIAVEIQDNGCGIPEAEIGNIFDFGFTTKGSSKQDGKPSGLGIGLFNSKHLMAKYGAAIQVRSRPGETVFTLRIPHRRETKPSQDSGV